MSNPFNPLDWLSSAQDWFSKTERSSGFRPYLIFLIFVFGISLCLMFAFGHVKYANELALLLIAVSVVAFIIIFFIKSFSEPNFCRSETHVQKIMKIEMEKMGNETKQIEGRLLEGEIAVKENKLLSEQNKDNDGVQ